MNELIEGLYFLAAWLGTSYVIGVIFVLYTARKQPFSFDLVKTATHPASITIGIFIISSFVFIASIPWDILKVCLALAE